MFWTADKNAAFVTLTSSTQAISILGDPGADSGDKRKSKRAEKYGTKKNKERREEPRVSEDGL